MVQINDTALLLIDVQEKLFPKIEGHQEIERVILQTLESFQILNIPILITEQCPQKLGSTLKIFQKKVSNSEIIFEKVTFSVLKNEEIFNAVDRLGKKNWVLVGIESHICILQSAFDLLDQNYNVVVLEDAVGSRNINHKKIALSEMRKKNVRISCLETLLFELLGHAKHSNFKEISALLR